MQATHAIPVMLCAALTAAGPAFAHESPPPPSGVVTLDLGGHGSETLWPFTGTDFSGAPSDPLNLILLGDADPRQIRQALLALSGDRSAYGFPNAFPFNCTWADAIGRHQTGWAESDGWQGSAIQMECGAYGTLRFHLRLFREGPLTLGNVHFEVLIPGTTDHEVLAWELAEGFVKLDLVRSGALTTAPFETPPINPAPTYRTIRHQVFNGLPIPLRALLGLPLADQTSPVPIPTNGKATVVSLSQPLRPVAAESRLEYDQPFDQVIPRPFCSAGPLDFLKVKGTIRFTHRVKTSLSGSHTATFTAAGLLDVTPVNPLTGEPTGPPFTAFASEGHSSSVTDRSAQAGHVVLQTLFDDPPQAFVEHLKAGRVDQFARRISCASPAP